MSTASYFFLTTKQAWKQINSFLLSLRLFLILISAEICALPAEQGNCFGNKRRWYYDGASGQCSTFTYGGCKGNGNNFKTKEECEAECRSDIESKTKEAGKGLVLGELLCWNSIYLYLWTIYVVCSNRSNHRYVRHFRVLYQSNSWGYYREFLLT